MDYSIYIKAWVSTFCSSADRGLPQPCKLTNKSDTHANVLLIHPKVCDEGLAALTHTTGLHFQHSRGIKLYVVFDLQLNVVVSISQSTKHRVTLFHHVVSPFIFAKALGFSFRSEDAANIVIIF